MARHLNAEGTTLRYYIDDFGGMAHTKAQATFTQPGLLLKHLGIVEAEHKASPPVQQMVWLGLKFGTVAMTINIPQEKLAEVDKLVHE